MGATAEHHPSGTHLRQLACHAEHVGVRRDVGVEQDFRFAAAQEEEFRLGQNVEFESRQGCASGLRCGIHEASAVGREYAGIDHYVAASHDVISQRRHGFCVADEAQFDRRGVKIFDHGAHLPRNDLCRKGVDALDAAEALHRDGCDGCHGTTAKGRYRHDVGLHTGSARSVGTRDAEDDGECGGNRAYGAYKAKRTNGAYSSRLSTVRAAKSIMPIEVLPRMALRARPWRILCISRLVLECSRA